MFKNINTIQHGNSTNWDKLNKTDFNNAKSYSRPSARRILKFATY